MSFILFLLLMYHFPSTYWILVHPSKLFSPLYMLMNNDLLIKALVLMAIFIPHLKYSSSLN